MMKIKKYTLIVVVLSISYLSQAQTFRWQQAVDYTMIVKLDVKTHNFSGTQKLVYTNNSPDTLNKVFYHLYFNAFQPGSMMDVRSRNIEDPDRRVGSRIASLTPSEIGMLEPISLLQDGSQVNYIVDGTILEVTLAKPILPNSETTFDMKFKGQVPVQIRRSGRDNKEGIDYSMSQWYPKICEYDQRGWHPNPYIAREFYGVWGNFDVKITIDSDYVVTAGAILQNPEEVNYGYSSSKKNFRGKEATFHFKSENVHDFMWAADRDYVHRTVQVPDGPLMHYFYVEDDVTKETWPQLMEISPKMVGFMNKQFGKYPYSDFYVIQGGDGGMEYPMGTLINGRGSLRGLVSVTLHEMFHSWYYGVLGTNESLYSWMDEGFTSYAQHLTNAFLYGRSNSPENWIKRYTSVAMSGAQEPLTTHSDHYNYNGVYGASAYTFGALVPYQLAYIMGQETFDKAFRDYYYTWGYKHPEPEDFEQIMEKHSNLILDWFFIDWIGTIKHLDYAINSVEEAGGKTKVEIINKNQRPMPVEVMVYYTDGSKERFYMPMRIMRGAKKFKDDIKTTQLPDWAWTNPTYSFEIEVVPSKISKIEIDPARGTVDIDYSNNTWEN